MVRRRPVGRQRADLSRLIRFAAQGAGRPREVLARVKEPEPTRDALHVPVGDIQARPDGCLPYSTSPISLLETDGALLTDLVAGARFVLNTQHPELERTHVIDYRRLRTHRA